MEVDFEDDQTRKIGWKEYGKINKDKKRCTNWEKAKRGQVGRKNQDKIIGYG